MLSPSSVPQIILPPSSVPQMMMSPSCWPITRAAWARCAPQTTSVLQTIFERFTNVFGPHCVLRSLAMSHRMVFLVPHMMFAFVSQMMLVPQMMVRDQIIRLRYTRSPPSTLVPQMMFWAQRYDRLPIMLAGSMPIVSHQSPSFALVLILPASATAPAALIWPAPSVRKSALEVGIAVYSTIALTLLGVSGGSPTGAELASRTNATTPLVTAAAMLVPLNSRNALLSRPTRPASRLGSL